jgi:CRP-like cAMP-binding protein
VPGLIYWGSRMERAPVGNRLLDTLPPSDFELLKPHLRLVALKRDAILLHSGSLAEQIFFPTSGLIASIMEMPNGEAAATAVFGNEGASGMLASLGPVPSPTTAVVRVAGYAWQIRPAPFNAALRRSSTIGKMVQTFTRALVAQLQQIAACNALHPVEQRMALWLLRLHDETEDDVLRVTQDAMAELLGVRRPTVTQVAAKLKDTGAIRSARRGVVEVDRGRLEATTCHCYQAISFRLSRILPREEAPRRPHRRDGAEHDGSHT